MRSFAQSGDVPAVVRAIPNLMTGPRYAVRHSGRRSQGATIDFDDE